MDKAALFQLIQKRGLKLPVSTAKRTAGPTKMDFMQALQRADESPQDLCSLPVELRIMICEYLLVFENGRRTCFP